MKSAPWSGRSLKFQSLTHSSSLRLHSSSLTQAWPLRRSDLVLPSDNKSVVDRINERSKKRKRDDSEEQAPGNLMSKPKAEDLELAALNK